MARPRFTRLEPERQRAVLDAAATEFAANGFEGASYNRIIAAAGVSKGAMYYYFDDKADLYATVVRAAVDEVAVAAGPLAAFTDAPGFWAEVEAKTAVTLGAVMGRPQLAELARSVYAELATTSSGPLGALVDELRALTVDLLTRGAAVGAVRTDLPPDLLARVVIGAGIALDTWFLEQWGELPPAELMALGLRCTALFRSMLTG